MSSNEQLNLFARPDLPGSLGIDQLKFPDTVRYFDDYSENTYSIDRANAEDLWLIVNGGRRSILKFSHCPSHYKHLLKFWTVHQFGNRQPRTAYQHAYWMIKERAVVIEFLRSFLNEPTASYRHWTSLDFSMKDPSHALSALKSLLRCCVQFNLGAWTSDMILSLDKLPIGGGKDKHKAVREGKVFLSPTEEMEIVAFLDEVASHPTSFQTDVLQAANVLYWNYSHGLRPIQIANRDTNHLRFSDFSGKPKSAHLTFRHSKQRSSGRNREETRAMRRDWVPIILEWYNRSQSKSFRANFDRDNSLFGLTPDGVSDAIGRLAGKLCKRVINATMLRHTAAQRMVDSGATALELAEFLTHADLQTGQIYYDISPTMADRVNKALGLSPVYSDLTEFLAGNAIDRFELEELGSDNQIGSAPHGRLIVGIGGCALGQSTCAKNPGLSCYTCHKFMPLFDTDVHKTARDETAGVVQEFVALGKEDPSNPAFMQLRRTLESMDSLIEHIDRN